MWEIEFSDSGDQVPETIRPAQIHRHESEAHENRCHRQQFAENDQVVQFLVVVNINRYDEHRCGRGDADDESEIGNIDSPRNLVAHSRRNQAMSELPAIGVQAKKHEGEEPARPCEITPIANESDSSATREKRQIVLNGADHTSK